MSANEKLLEQVRRELNITWSDPDTDKSVEHIALSAKSAMAHMLGVGEEYDFSVPGLENTLVLACARYLWNKVDAEVFEENYKKMILRARAIHEVEQAVEDGDV